MDPATGGTVATPSGTLLINHDGTYSFAPTIVYETVIGGQLGFPGSANSWKQSGDYNGYTYEAVRVEGGDTALGGLYHPTSNTDGQLSIEGQGQDAGMGIKGGDGLDHGIDGATAPYDEGMLITPAAGAQGVAISFGDLGTGESVKWVAYGDGGTVLGSGVFAGGTGTPLIVGQDSVTGTIHTLSIICWFTRVRKTRASTSRKWPKRRSRT